MLYPLFFKPLYKEAIWGGRNIGHIFKRKLPDGNIAESWEICCHDKGKSVITNGILSGNTLEEAIDEDRMGILGKNNYKKDIFPLLVKFLDAHDRLSVQVHPDDKYAKKYENELGKTEMWYVIDADKESRIVYGLKEGMSKDIIVKSLENGSVAECLNYVKVKRGDVIFIPPGTVHALLKGVVVLEIQQNSDITYRLYDWNRRDMYGRERELHIEKALDVLNFEPIISSKKHNLRQHEGFNKKTLVKSKYFISEKIEVLQQYKDKTYGESFYIFNCISGKGKLLYKELKYSLQPGDTFMIPAFLGEFNIEGKIDMIKTYVD